MLKVFRAYGFEVYVTVELYSECYKDPELLLANASRILGQIRRDLNV